MKILVCDDDPLMGLIVSNIIGTDGHAVEVAFDGQEALELLQARAFDLLITDQEMPGLTGIELIQKLRAFNVLVKIIMITGFQRHDIRMKNLPAVDGFLSKPFKAAALLDCLGNVGC